jgi:hypothetical protein
VLSQQRYENEAGDEEENMSARVGQQTYQLPEELTQQVNASLAEWQTRKNVQRLWAHDASFGVVKAAQARGDFQVLVDRQRRALRVHLGKDVHTGLATLRTALAETLM